MAVSRHVLDMWVARVETPFTQEVADFVSGQIIGTLFAMAFRWWAFRKFVFPHADVRPRYKDEEVDIAAAELLGDVWPLIDEPDSTDRELTESDRELLESGDTEDPLRTRR